MDYALSLGQIMGPAYLVFGLSMLFYPKAWKKLIDKFAGDHLSLLPLMFGYMILGLISIRLHNVWSWDIWLLVTLTGWGLFLKSVFYFLAPGEYMTSLLKWKAGHMCMYTAGTIVTVIGLALSYFSFMQ